MRYPCVASVFGLAYSGIHIDIDNLNVLRGVAKLIDQGVTGTALPLVKDGDFRGTINSMLCLRSVDAVKVSKVTVRAPTNSDLIPRARKIEFESCTVRNFCRKMVE